MPEKGLGSRTGSGQPEQTREFSGYVPLARAWPRFWWKL